MTVQHAMPECETTTQTGVVSSNASGPGGLLLARLLGLPREGCVRADLDVTAIEPLDPCTPTVWRRRFGAKTWTSTVFVTPEGLVVERVGVAVLQFEADVQPDRLELRSTAARIGPVGWFCRLPIDVCVSVAAIDEAMVTSVDVDLGRLGALRYEATMRESTIDETGDR